MPRTPTVTSKDNVKGADRRSEKDKVDGAGRRSAAVRSALLNPSHRQLSRWEREERQRNLIIFGATGLAVISVAVLLFGYVQHTVLRAQETAAVVHGERITTGQLLQTARPTYEAVRRQQELLSAQGQQQQAQQLAFQIPSLPGQILNAEVEHRLIQREAEARGIAVADAEVQAEIRESMEREAQFANPLPAAGAEGQTPETPELTDAEVESAYQRFLQRTGLTDDFYRAEVRKSLLREKVSAAVAADAPASAEQVHARHILLATEEEAQEVLARLQAGADFAEVAEAESLDTGSSAEGGDLDWFPRGIMNQAFETAAFAAEPGAAPQIVQSPNGWHVLQVLERSQDRPLEDVDRQLLESRRFQEWLQAAQQSDQVQVELSGEESDWVLGRLQSRFF